MSAAIEESKRAQGAQNEALSEKNLLPSYNKKGYWISELESLGISPKGTSELDIQELRHFVENLKQMLLEEYRAAYHHDNSD
jgi:hypothetical protein